MLRYSRPGLPGPLEIRDLVFHGSSDLLEPVAQLHLLGSAVLLQGGDDLEDRGNRIRGDVSEPHDDCRWTSAGLRAVPQSGVSTEKPS